MTPRLALAFSLATLIVSPANAAPSVEEVAALIANKLACPARDAADGFVLTTETDTNGKYASRAVVIIDRKSHRMLSRSKIWSPSNPSVAKLLVYAWADGAAYGCTVAATESCVPSALGITLNNVQRDITSRYMTFRDFLAPDRGGAHLALETPPADVEGAAWTLVVTPPGGLPLVMHAAVDGTMKAMDVRYPDASVVRTSYADRKLFEDCETASSMRQTTHPKDTGYVQSTVVSIETRATMTPADTPVDQPVASP